MRQFLLRIRATGYAGGPDFTRQFNQIFERGEFHDLRRTALTNWLANGMTEHKVMVLAGHASFSTTHRFYLAVADDLVDRTRETLGKVLCQDLLRTPHFAPKRKKADNRK